MSACCHVLFKSEFNSMNCNIMEMKNGRLDFVGLKSENVLLEPQETDVPKYSTLNVRNRVSFRFESGITKVPLVTLTLSYLASRVSLVFACLPWANILHAIQISCLAIQSDIVYV